MPKSIPPVLVVGRALHRPWNEGTRVIAWNIAQAANLLRPVRVVSLTQTEFADAGETSLPLTHVLTKHAYGARGDYAALPSLLRTLRAEIQEHGIEIAHLIGVPLVVAAWLRLQGVRTIVHVPMTRQVYRGQTERLRATLGWRLFDRWIDVYACASEPVLTALEGQGYPRQKLQLVLPPLDVTNFQPGDRAAARAQLGFAPDAFVVAYIGTISPLRFPVNDIVQALNQAAPNVARLEMAIYAPVSTHAYNTAWADAEVKPALAQAQVPVQLHLQDLDEAQKAALYTAADAVLLPFTAPVAVEPPLTLLEAMACEATVIVAPYANRSRLVEHTHNGLSYTTPSELTTAIQWIANLPPAERAALRQQARASLIQRHSMVAVAARLHAMWQSLEDPPPASDQPTTSALASLDHRRIS